MRTRRSVTGFWAVAAAAAVLGTARPAEARGGGAPGGSIAGVVTTGRKPTAKPIPVAIDPDVCGTTEPDERLVVTAGHLANAVVFVTNPPKGAAPAPRHLLLDQKRCRYIPHVQATTTGSTLVIKNSDATVHNVHAYDQGGDTLFNLAMPIPGQVLDQRLEDPGMVSFKCDAGHTWMSAYVYVFNHPWFAVTGPDGHFTIKGLPPGTYHVKVWQETLGTRTATVTVKRGKAAHLNVRM